MSIEPAPLPRPVSRRPSSPVWFHARPLWAGVAIMTMWLAVLFVGVFGENIVSATAGGDSASVPVVVALLPFVLPATIVVARRGFSEASQDRPRESEDTTAEPLPRSTPKAV